MNLYALLAARAAAGKPVRIGLIGAGKFASMFLAQTRTTPGFHVVGIADLSVPRAAEALRRTGWPAESYAARGFDEALSKGSTFLTDDAEVLLNAGGIDVAIEATGDPAAGIRHALIAVAAGKHMVMVNVEADALAGPLLRERASKAGLVYSLAYGDQPALIAEQVDWARASGFEIVAAGKGTKYRPEFHASTPDTVWGYYGVTPEAAKAGGMNPKMFNSFLDGTKSGIEMAAVANATGLTPAPGGLTFPAIGVDDLPRVLKPRSAGGVLHHKGQVEVISSERHEGGPVPRDLRWGTYVVFEAPSDYVARCFGEYGLKTDETGRYAALYRPYHLIGLELGISVASAALRGEATGAPAGFRGDVVATAKRDLRAGETLDGEGGYTVWGTLMPAGESLRQGALPIGLAQGCALLRPVAAGGVLTRADVALDETALAVRIRNEMERVFGPKTTSASRAAQ